MPQESVRRILESGRLTGSSMNGQPWHFVVVQEQATLQEIGRLVRSGPYIAAVPMAIVVVTDRTPYAVSDASRAIQSMLLTAWADGLGSNWAGFGGLDAVRTLLAIPEQLDVFAILPIGYPVDPVGRGDKQRKALGQIAHRERWGTPFEQPWPA